MNDASQPNPDWIEPTEEDKKCRPHCASPEEARELFRQYKAGLISEETFESKSGWRFWPIKGGVPEKIPAQNDAARWRAWKRAWNELSDKVEKAGLDNADYTGECE